MTILFIFSKTKKTRTPFLSISGVRYHWGRHSILLPIQWSLRRSAKGLEVFTLILKRRNNVIMVNRYFMTVGSRFIAVNVDRVVKPLYALLMDCGWSGPEADWILRLDPASGYLVNLLFQCSGPTIDQYIKCCLRRNLSVEKNDWYH